MVLVSASECRSRAVLLFSFLVIIAWFNGSAVEARIHRYKWEVKHEYKSPDCFKKLVITINGQIPGPPIRAQQNDTIIVELTNSLLTENVSIHWHGIKQIQNGTEGVTLPGTTFKYQFVVNRPGTYLYHAHDGMQREAGLYGSTIVALPKGKSEPFPYDYDRNIILSDWYHKSTYDQATGLSATPFQWVGDPQSLLIHGRGKFNCSALTSSEPGVCNATKPECSRFTLIVVPGKTYRLRVFSLTAMSDLSFQIEVRSSHWQSGGVPDGEGEKKMMKQAAAQRRLGCGLGHNMTVVEADGHYVEPFVVQNLFIYSGETYSVLVKADQDPTRNYWITSNVVGRDRKTPAGLANFVYYPNHPSRSPPTTPPIPPGWNNTAPRIEQSKAIKARQGFIHTPPPLPDRVIILHNITDLRNRSVKNVSFTPSQIANLINTTRIMDNLTRANYQTPQGCDFLNYDIFKLVKSNANATSNNGSKLTMDIILQNSATHTHVWNLNGTDFWVLGYGEGKFDMVNDTGKYNLVNPVMKKTVPVHPNGWTAVRFEFDNNYSGAQELHRHAYGLSHFVVPKLTSKIGYITFGGAKSPPCSPTQQKKCPQPALPYQRGCDKNNQCRGQEAEVQHVLAVQVELHY
ncbi:Multicopper oxidase, type 1 [Corchorus olitorius]|uniref:Multicopper oxidase, type 1 n=1 Tax=Corchorus olitorius TaxID=93759 RepID=A0A1R3KAR9_9ROSI|nr:Multicopper oxidase, type 1 [Corchorus olitorius]